MCKGCVKKLAPELAKFGILFKSLISCGVQKLVSKLLKNANKKKYILEWKARLRDQPHSFVNGGHDLEVVLLKHKRGSTHFGQLLLRQLSYHCLELQAIAWLLQSQYLDHCE